MGLSSTFCITRSIRHRRGRGFSHGRLILLRCEISDMGDIRQHCLISAAPASWDKPHLSNYRAFLDNDVTADRKRFFKAALYKYYRQFEIGEKFLKQQQPSKDSWRYLLFFLAFLASIFFLATTFFLACLAAFLAFFTTFFFGLGAAGLMWIARGAL